MHCPLVSPLSRGEQRERTKPEKMELHTKTRVLKEVTTRSAGEQQGDLMMQGGWCSLCGGEI